MKSKDIALIAVIVIISAIFSLVISNALISPNNKKQEVEVVQPISSELKSPDTKYFNETSIDPTLTITIGENANSDPFNGTSQ